MRNVLIFIVVVIVAVGALGYWRGWFSVAKEGNVDVQVDSSKFKQDRDAFGKSVGEKAKEMKDQIASLSKKSQALTGDEKTQAEKELAELEKKHDRLQKQIKELGDTGEDKFEGIKQDLSKNLEEVEKKIEKLTKKLEKGKDK
jgi:chromosome segregation ATPase